ncbi:hypothetical protein MTO96_038302 [Rhipicephalus appendiculatus]
MATSPDRCRCLKKLRLAAASKKTTGDKAVGSYDSMELDFVSATAHIVGTDKRQLDRLRRACSAAVPGERCWLSSELTSWNRVLNWLEYELVETRPGSVRLQRTHCDPRTWSAGGVNRNAAFLISWLLEHHLCIDEFSLICPVHTSCWDPLVSYSIRMRPSVGSKPDRYFRYVKIEMAKLGFRSFTRDERGHVFALEGLNTVYGVEKLKVASSWIRSKFAAELESLLLRNASTLKAVKVTNAILQNNFGHESQCLKNCESLTRYPHSDWGRHVPSLTSVAQLLRTTSALKNLSIYICPIEADKLLTTLSEAVKANTSLTKLSVCSEEIKYSPEPLFAALQANETLKELQLQECEIRFSGEALEKALCMNTGLRILRITESDISHDCLQHLAAVLRVNSTLEELELSSRESLYYRGIFVLCSSLAQNKTLKKLTLGEFGATEQGREALAQMLATNDSYGRVQLPWAKADINGLWNVLISPTACPKEVSLRNIHRLSKEDLGLLFDAIASSEHVRTLRTSWEGDVWAQGAAFCEMLKSNRSIRTLDIIIGRGNANLIHDVFHALAENKGIAKVMFGTKAIESNETVTDISYFLAHDKTATAFYMTTMHHSLSAEFVEEFSKGMWQNRLIVDFKVNGNLIHDDGTFAVFEAVRRNKATLNRAVDFIVLHKADRECAEAFELFSEDSCSCFPCCQSYGKNRRRSIGGRGLSC